MMQVHVYFLIFESDIQILYWYFVIDSYCFPRNYLIFMIENEPFLAKIFSMTGERVLPDNFYVKVNILKWGEKSTGD